ncbi:MAG: hypothetical protein K2O74_04605, partial [Eubacteriales bacterium]|nr:hypothetical protein [Eubacteriales bacterium]
GGNSAALVCRKAACMGINQVGRKIMKEGLRQKRGMRPYSFVRPKKPDCQCGKMQKAFENRVQPSALL